VKANAGSIGAAFMSRNARGASPQRLSIVARIEVVS
jgi:hypothetical protein